MAGKVIDWTAALARVWLRIRRLSRGKTPMIRGNRYDCNTVNTENQEHWPCVVGGL
jgi:hypothetical protein